MSAGDSILRLRLKFIQIVLYCIVMQVELSAKNVTWRNVADPSPEELAALVRESNLAPIDAEFIAQNYHHPEITVRPEYLLLLIHVPVFNKQLRVTTAASLSIVATGQQLWTLHYEPIVVLEKLLQDFTDNPDKQSDFFDEGGVGLALHVIAAMYSSAFTKLERLYKHINIAEDAVFSGNERKMVEEISILSRDVMDFRKIIRPQQRLFSHVPTHALLSPTALTLWQRISGQVNKLWDMLESLSESISEVAKTNKSLLQYKQSQLLQMLTYYSILSIPAFILVTPFNPLTPQATSFYHLIYWGTLLLLIAILGFIFLRFRGKRVL